MNENIEVEKDDTDSSLLNYDEILSRYDLNHKKNTRLQLEARLDEMKLNRELDEQW